MPGGTFDRSNIDGYPAMVLDFNLDVYEVTVGRFRAFVNAGKGTLASPPASGAGANPHVGGSGWQTAWNSYLTANSDSLKAALNPDNRCTWTDMPGANEVHPINCVTWFEAFAFCGWDGGWIPTEAEWNYAAAGGSEQRQYPWSAPPSSTVIDDTYAVYCGGSCVGTLDVGSRSPKGNGRWGHADLGGNVWEWVLDWWSSSYPVPCNECANLIDSSNRVYRGGSFEDIASDVRSTARFYWYPSGRAPSIGLRCARSP